MSELVLLDVLGNIGTIFGFIAIPLATIILGIKLFKEKLLTNSWNYIRIIIFTTFLSFSIYAVAEYIAYSSPIASQELQDLLFKQNFTLNNFC